PPQAQQNPSGLPHPMRAAQSCPAWHINPLAIFETSKHATTGTAKSIRLATPHACGSKLPRMAY
ncbi:hypothetical protein ACLXAZ_33565, partial [Escherichia coli]